MARAYSDALRKKVLDAYASGKGTLKQLAERLDVSYGWVAKPHLAQLRTGSATRPPQRRHGRLSRVAPEAMRMLVRRQSDIVLRELQAELRKSGVEVSSIHLWRVLKRLGLRLKKSRSTPPSETRRPSDTARSVPRLSRARRALEDAHYPGRDGPYRHDRRDDHRGRDRLRGLPRLPRPGAGPKTASRPCRRHGQPQRPQSQRRAPAHRASWASLLYLPPYSPTSILSKSSGRSSNKVYAPYRPARLRPCTR
jgi:transposase